MAEDPDKAALWAELNGKDPEKARLWAEVNQGPGLGSFEGAGQNIASGFVSALGSAGVGVKTLLGTVLPEDSKVMQLMGQGVQAVEEATPEPVGRGFIPDVLQGLGSTGFFFLGGPAGAPGIASMGALSNGGSEYLTHLQEKPGDEEGAFKAFLIGGTFGLTEAAPLRRALEKMAGPVAKVLESVNKRTNGGLVRKMLLDLGFEAAEEAGQEGLQSAVSEFLGKHLRGDELGVLEAALAVMEDPEALGRIGHGAAVGAAASGPVSVLGSAVQAARAREALQAAESLQEGADEARMEPRSDADQFGSELVRPQTDKVPEAVGEPVEGDIAPAADADQIGRELVRPQAAPLVPDPDVVTVPEGFTGEPLIGGEKPQVEPVVDIDSARAAPTPEEIAAEGEEVVRPVEPAEAATGVVEPGEGEAQPVSPPIPEPEATPTPTPEAVEAPTQVEEQTVPIEEVAAEEPVAEIRAEDEDARLEVAAEEAGVSTEEFVRKMAEPKPGVKFTFAGPPPVVGLELGNLLKGRWGASKALGKKFFTASGNLPTSAFESRIRRDAKVRAANQDVRFAAMDFRSAASKVYGRREMKPEQMAAIDMALRNDKLVDSLPEPLRVPTRALRRHVDALSQALVSAGVVEGDLAARVLTPDEGKGTGLGVYLTRSYRVFDDPDWAREGPEGELVTKATPEIIARAKSLLRREYKGRSEDEIEGLLRKLLFVGQEADSPIALLKRGKLGHKDLSILRGRKEIAPEIRALWGEYEDPLVNYARSVTKMSHLIANHQFLEEVAASGSEEGWLLRPEDGPKGRFAVQIAAEASEVMEPLNGYWTSPEIKQAFEDAEGARKVLGTIMRWYMKMISLTKISKTVLSPVTHLRNVTGNVGFVVANAHWRLGKMSGAFKGVLTDAGLVKSEEWRAAYRRALELGVIHESANANELRDMIQDSVQFDVAEAIEEHGKLNLKSLTKRGLNVTMRLYRLEDDFWKLYAFENEKARYRKAQPTWSEEQVEAHAAKLVRNLYPTYSQVPEAIRLLRRSPIFGTFVSFPWEVARTAKNTIVTIQDELTSDNAEVRKIGAQRLVGATMAATSTAALAAALRFIMGLDREEDENAREFMPPWSRNSDILWVGQSEDGSWNYVDAGYTDPYSYLKSPLKAFLRGENWQEGVVDAVFEAADPFTSTEILTGAILDLRERMNSDEFKALPLRDQSEEVFNRLAKALEPGFVTQGRRLRKAFSDEVERYGRAYDPKVEVFNSLAGIRINTLDIQQSLSFLAFEYQSTLQGAQKIVSREASRRGEVPESDLRDAYESTEAARRRAYEGMRRVVSAASSLGESEDEIRQTLSGSLSRKEVHHVLSGTYQPYIPSSSFLSTYMKGSDEERRAELIGRAQAIRGYSLEAREGATNDG